MRSSDEGASHGGGVDEIGLDDRTRIERKIEQIKERLSRISLAREGIYQLLFIFLNKNFYHGVILNIKIFLAFFSLIFVSSNPTHFFNIISADVDDFLSMTSNMENGSENPQLARVRQHFEKKNKKSSQEIEHLKVSLKLI